MATESAPLSSLTSLGQTPDPGDLLYVVDVSDTSEGANGTSKSVTYNHISSGGGGGQPASTTTTWFSHAQLNGQQGNISTVAGTRYWSELMIYFDSEITGIAYTTSGFTGTVKIITELHDDTGALVATSSTAGTLVDEATTTPQLVPFTIPYTASAGRYFAALQFDTTFDPTLIQFKADGSATGAYISGSATGTFGVGASITPGSSYTVGVAPVCSTY